jgi:hypothetical protein
MPETRSWVLTDVDRDIWKDKFELKPDDIGLEPETPWSIKKHTLQGGLRHGVDLIEINNGEMSFSVVPTRGMGISRGQYRGNMLGWYSPVRGPVHPKFVNATERGGLGWLQGFDEWIVRCGLDSNGAPGTDTVIDNNGNPADVELTLHGKIANLPAHYVEVQVTSGKPQKLAVVGHVEESMLFSPQMRLVSTVSTMAGSNRLTITDEIVNLKEVPAELELLYHCNFGGPFLDDGAMLTCPIREVAPRDARAVLGIKSYNSYHGPTAGYIEEVFWYDLASEPDGKTLVMLRNAHGDKGVALRFNKKQLPCFTQWKNTAALTEGYVTGLEPATNYPNPKRFERDQNRVIRIAPEGTYVSTLEIEVHVNSNGVAALEKEIAAIQKTVEPTVHKKPQPRYSPVG